MGRKVYAVRWWMDEWQLCEAEVESETATSVTLSASGTALGGFGYRREHPPGSLASSPSEAVAKKLVEENAVAKRMVDDIAQQHERIRKLAALGGRVIDNR